MESVSNRFTQIYSDPLTFITTLHDPCYKDHYWDEGIKQRTQGTIQAAMDMEKLTEQCSR